MQLLFAAQFYILFIQLSNLNDLWMRKPIYYIKSHEYRIRQMMELIYSKDLDEQLEHFEFNQFLNNNSANLYNNVEHLHNF